MDLLDRDHVQGNLLDVIDELRRRVEELERALPGRAGESLGSLAYYRPSDGSLRVPVGIAVAQSPDVSPDEGELIAQKVEARVASGDPLLVFDIGGTDEFAVGVDDSDDLFKIHSSGSLADTSDLELASGGALTLQGTLRLDSSGMIELNRATDSRVRLMASDVYKWALGVDSDDGDKLKASVGASIDAASEMELDTSGNLAVGGLYAGTLGADAQTGYIQSTVGASGWLPFVPCDSLPSNIQDGDIAFRATIPRALTLRSWHQGLEVDGTNNGSNYWTLTLEEVDGTDITTLDTSGESGPTGWIMLSDAGRSDSLSTSDIGLQIVATKTGSPGTLRLLAPAVFVT